MISPFFMTSLNYIVHYCEIPSEEITYCAINFGVEGYWTGYTSCKFESFYIPVIVGLTALTHGSLFPAPTCCERACYGNSDHSKHLHNITKLIYYNVKTKI